MKRTRTTKRWRRKKTRTSDRRNPCDTIQAHRLGFVLEAALVIACPYLGSLRGSRPTQPSSAVGPLPCHQHHIKDSTVSTAITTA
jgi:hypothetical protein